ncbi:hypothetical protein AJ80_02973 [Polytolypa hystricis UAMH7299]|uniref:Dihydrofolate synthetase n=1 Tax=Polytolypa hystricis (strain UAMH7299) TaxID=1447883 RepID=A0A2B7YFS2_POLH7|nr:hypothetical protein AJ80_02973 [Polytolypa hystricis UAMH7299]
MIELGLSRIARLVQQSNLSWKAIHVAGTNGKGSITGYLSALLTAGGVRCGSFTSPHLIDRWDCITINERVVQESVFRRIENEVKQRNQTLDIGATEFELLTATAFEIFNHEQIEVGVVEVGMGGRLDATNILRDVLVSIIAKIGHDHQAVLGNTIEEIALEKGGIMKLGSPCVVDGTNLPVVKALLEEHARKVGTSVTFAYADTVQQLYPDLVRIFRDLELEPHQQANLASVVTALQEALPKVKPGLELSNLFSHISKVPRAGRLQEVSLEPLVPRKEPVLLDGAHNPQSAEVLSRYVDRKLRKQGENVTWVIAASQGKDLRELLGCMIKPGDNVAAVRFGPVDGMPWVRSVKTSDLISAAQSACDVGQAKKFGRDILEGLNWAHEVSAGSPLVIAGSLYLVSDVLRLRRDSPSSKTKPEEEDL